MGAPSLTSRSPTQKMKGKASLRPLPYKEIEAKMSLMGALALLPSTCIGSLLRCRLLEDVASPKESKCCLSNGGCVGTKKIISHVVWYTRPRFCHKTTGAFLVALVKHNEIRTTMLVARLPHCLLLVFDGTFILLDNDRDNDKSRR